MTALLTNQTSNGNGAAVAFAGSAKLLIISGTFNGATVTLEASRDGTTFAALKDASWTAAVATLISLPQWVRWRVYLSQRHLHRH